VNPNVPIDLTLAQLYSSIVGIVLPPILEIFFTVRWDSRARSIAAFLACLAGAIIVQWASNQWDPAHVGMSIGLAVMSAFTSYKALWKPTGAAQNIREHVGSTVRYNRILD
jgi:hypothetical protein